ncbi:MAG TPA: hypothetical protein VK680_07000 [Solirubrobacteraceae bacterium]|jgi:hypothetical protein|nr:hypothetical protein [Solirubrobacteraceae bacterium]
MTGTPKAVSVVIALLTTMLGTCASTASAAAPAPAWSLQSVAQPTSFSPSDNGLVRCEPQQSPAFFYPGCDRYTIALTNVGTRASSGIVTVRDILPAGFTTSHAPGGEAELSGFKWECTTEELVGREIVICTTERAIPPLSAAPTIQIPVNVTPAAGTFANEVTASGGEAGTPVTAEISTAITVAPEPFAPLDFSFSELDQAGASDTQAGSHPGAFTASFFFPSANSFNGFLFAPLPVQEVKQIVTDLPSGVIGDALAAPTCSLSDVTDLNQEETQCPSSTRVGRLALIIGEKTYSELSIFNVTPERGFPAEFAVFLPSLERAALLYASVVGSGADAHVRVISAPQDGAVTADGVSITFFGNPAVIDDSPLTPTAFATNPSDCSAIGFTSTLYVDSWQNPAKLEPDGQPDLSDPNWKRASSTSPPVSGCAALQFHPTFSLQPTTVTPDSPSGVNAELQIPQNEDPNGLATPPLKDASVTLPQGFVVNPSSATGLQGCTDAQIDLASPEPGSCPEASQIGEVTVHTPLLAEPLTGPVFLGTPECDPCAAADAQSGRMIRAFIQVTSQRFGVTVKVPGNVRLDPATGRLTATFDDSPQQPFSDLEFKFKEGPRAPLATPATCGSFETSASLTAWSAPYTPTVSSPSSFVISGCAGNPFSPAFTAGTVASQAGQYSPFVLSFSRADREQDFNALEAILPPGVLAKLAGVQQCGEAEIAAARADTGECPTGSQIGSVTVAAGPGSSPFYTTGKVYLTGAYNGGPFGEATVVPAVAGPFNLGNVVVRGSIRVNSNTAQGSVLSDPFPSILDGIPLQVRSVNVTLDRPDFTFNATSCEPMKVTGTLTSTRGSSAHLSSPYRAADCQGLPFKPQFTASTNGHTSKANGASLRVKISYPSAGEANIAKVDLEIPSSLPSRLTTLQKACTEVQFNANPAGCPAASDIATAIVRTPLLSSPLVGPAYLVSHGGAAFPDTELILQGEGVTLILDGHTKIIKGVTFSRFESVPDAPFSSFEFLAPEGPYSIFTAYGNLCALTKTATVSKRITRRVHGHNRKVTVKVKQSVAQPLVMPTSITAQNGAVLEQDTKVAVTGCPTTKAAKKATAATKTNRSRQGRAAHANYRRGH